jgi:sugar phosphate isomerase/epimerase
VSNMRNHRLHTMTRREWLQLTTMGAVGTAALPSVVAQGKRPLGVQLYTVRDKLGADADATLQAIASIGYKEVELLRAHAARIAPLAKAHGLQSASMHIEPPLVTGNWDAWADAVKPEDRSTLERTLDDAKSYGVQYAIVSYLMPSERGGGEAFFEKFAEQLNRAGEAGKKAGIAIGYHNHGFEFEPLPDGRRPLDVLVARTDPSLVRLELDVFWIGITGASPVDLLTQYKGRVALLHLKDKAKDAARTTDERQVPKETFKEVGSGSLDFPAILKAAEAAGVEHYFVEQDHTPDDPIASLRKSYEFLQTIA